MRTVQHPTQDKKQVGEAIEVLARAIANGLISSQRHQRTFGATADGADVVSLGGSADAAGEDEILERLQPGVVVVDSCFQPLHLTRGDHAHPRNTDFAAEIKQVVLHVGEQRADCLRQGFGEEQAERGVGLVDLTDGVDAQAAFAHPLAVAKAGGAGVAGAGVDF